MKHLKTIGEYWDSRSDGFSRQVQEDLKENHVFWSSALQKRLFGIPGKKILDIGCGPGFFTVLLASAGYDVTAVDFSSDMLKEAEKNAKAAGLAPCFLQGDAQQLPFASETFDAVVSRNLTWNLERPEAAYREWLRVLKPGGCIINCDGNHYSHLYREEYLLERKQAGFSDGHKPEYMKNVNVNIIDTIAEDLPLSRELRPLWDIRVLTEMGIDHVETDITRHHFIDDDGKEYNLIKTFILKAVK